MFPTILVIFGATGDLVTKKIVPALFHLHRKQKLSRPFQVIGFARRDLSQDDFQNHIAGIVRDHLGHDVPTTDLKPFLELFTYHRGQFHDLADYERLAQTLGHLDGAWKTCANKLFYLAVPPESFRPIFEHLSASHLTDPCSPEEGWTRVIVEKPIGKDAKSAEALDELMGKMFQEEQIYRIDHYLAKEMVQAILSFRFSNSIFEDSWNNQQVEHIHIRLWESIGVEKRGAFYDGLGALRDVGQNHLLQMLAFATMEHPVSYEASAIRAKRAELLRQLKPLSVAAIQQSTFRAQYEGYRQIQGVAPDSMTETYFKIQAELESPRWSGVPITLESGKRMGEQQKDITFTFKHPRPCLCPANALHHFKNTIRFSIEPEERIALRMWVKKPGLEFEIEQRELDLLFRERGMKSQYVEEYEKLLLDCMAGDQTLFLRTDEVKAMWQYIDPIVRAWEQQEVPLHMYPPDTSLISNYIVVSL